MSNNSDSAALPALPADLAGLGEQANKLRGDLEAHNFDDAIALIDTALEALAVRQVAVTDEMLERAWLRAREFTGLTRMDNKSALQTVLEAALTAAPPAPQAAEEPVEGQKVMISDFRDDRKYRWNRDHYVDNGPRDTPPASAKCTSAPGPSAYLRGPHDPEYKQDVVEQSERMEAVASRHVVQELEGQKPVYSYNDPPLRGASERLYSEATVAAKQSKIDSLEAEIERLTRLHQASIRAVKKLRERAEAAEAELANLRQGLAEVRHLINTRGTHRAIPLIDAIIEGGDTWPERAEAFEKAAEMSRALLKGETE